MQGGSLLAAPFDLDALELTGAPVPVLDGMLQGTPSFSVSADGSLAYLRGDVAEVSAETAALERTLLCHGLDCISPASRKAIRSSSAHIGLPIRMRFAVHGEQAAIEIGPAVPKEAG